MFDNQCLIMLLKNEHIFLVDFEFSALHLLKQQYLCSLYICQAFYLGMSLISLFSVLNFRFLGVFSICEYLVKT